MNDLGETHLRTWALRMMAPLAADPLDQLAWMGEREMETKDLVEEAELLCRVFEAHAEHEALEPEDLRNLRAIDRRLGKIDATCHAGLWGNALTADPAWDDIRSLTRRFLHTMRGDWRQPLPRPVHPPEDNH
ncbi:hypothetical protein [Streptomyces hydrogenans]|uniref:hypothetical protein n=1 Tax=Streptomyces hydrogenans TaxID=1873719 RepID=UPI0036EA092E